MSKFCQLKYNHQCYFLNTGKISSCCKAEQDNMTDISFDQAHIKWLREAKDLKDGIEIESCQSCWNYEKKGMVSFRKQAHLTKGITRIELWMSNACNQMCSYCSPEFSSTWAQHIDEFKNGILGSKSIIPIINSDHLTVNEKKTDE